jgi:hypothetical protein
MLGKFLTKKLFNLSGRILILTVFLLSVLYFAPTLTTVKATAQIEIVSHSSYIGRYGYYTVVGEVQNVGDQNIDDAIVSGIFYNDKNEVLGNNSVRVPLFLIFPGRKSPFGFVLYDNTLTPQVDHYSLSVDFSSTDHSLPEKLAIISNSSSVVDGHFIINGEIENRAERTASLTKVLATCYDENGTVVVMGGKSALSIGANQTIAFQIDISENVPLIKSYELTAQSPFFAAIPEFNSLLMTMLVVSLISISFLLSKRKIIQNGHP